MRSDQKDTFFDAEIASLQKQSLLRELKTVETSSGRIIKINGKEYLNFSSNNYLGLANHPEVIKAVQRGAQAWGVGAGASRLLSGNLKIHEELEKALAEFKGTESCLLFPTGFAANTGVVTAVVGKEDVIFCDRLNHASIIDACIMSGAKLLVYPHKDIGKLKNILEKQRNKFRRALIVTDSLFSMDGDLVPLPEIVVLAKKYEAMTMIDEAHATGVMGNQGRGVVEHFHLENQIDIIMGTLSKAFGLQGGFVCGSQKLKKFLINKARSFIYTTALSPMIAAGALKALDIIKTKPALREKLWKNTNYVKEELVKKGFDIGESESPIIPIKAKATLQFSNTLSKTSTEIVLEISKKLFEKGIYVPAIRYPTVAKDQARLRVSVLAEHTITDFHKLFAALL